MKYRSKSRPEYPGVDHYAWSKGADFLLRQEPDEDEDDEDDDGKEDEDDDTESTDDGYSE
jgi:hypothetical protein